MRYEVQEWNGGYGAWDTVLHQFVEFPVRTIMHAEGICALKNRSEVIGKNFMIKKKGDGFGIWDKNRKRYLYGEPMSLDAARKACESINRVIL